MPVILQSNREVGKFCPIMKISCMQGQSVIDLYVPEVDQRTYFILDVFCTHSWLVSSLQACLVVAPPHWP
jgi:hypothetical protein